MGSAKKLLSNSSLLFVGTIIASFFSYLFNMLAGRMLGPEKYGEFSSLMSLTTILSVGGGALTIVCMKYISELYAGKNYAALKKLVKFFTKAALVIGVSLFLIGLIFLRPIANYLSIQSSVPIIVALSNLIIGFLIVINRGFLQGTQKFLVLSGTNALEMLLRLMVGIFFVRLGFQSSGAIAGVVLAMVIVYLVTFFPLVRFFRVHEGNQEKKFQFDKKDIIKYAIPSLVASLLLAVAMNIDVILVKHYFDPATAGMYAAISTISKIVFFAMGPIVSVMFPMISAKKTTGEKHYQLFLGSLAITLLGALVILGIYYIAPGTIIRILYGDKFVSQFVLLPQLGFAMLLYSMVNLLVNYFMVIRNYVFTFIFAACLTLLLVLVVRNHSSLEVFVKIFIGSFGLLFALLFGYYLITKKDQLLSYIKGEYGEKP